MKLRVLGCAVGAAIVMAVVPSPAQAQLPSLPQLPRFELPEPLDAAAEQGIDTVLPLIGQTAIQLRPGATLAGFALRVPCSALGGASFVLALGSSIVVLPLPTGAFLGPALIFCSGALEEGPADPAFDQLDDATGDQLEGALTPVLLQIAGAVEPARSSLDEGCGVVRIFAAAPQQAPPPLHRFNYVALVCG